MSKNQTAGDFTGGLPHDEAVLLQQAARSGCLGSKSELVPCDQEGDDPRFATNNGLQQAAMIPTKHFVPSDDLDACRQNETRIVRAQMVS